ncbi:hypothetical protein JCM6882_001591 [Rhodosporidiobolus microsporus]
MATTDSDSTLTPLASSSAAPLSPLPLPTASTSTSSALASPCLAFRSAVQSALRSLSDTLAARRAGAGEGPVDTEEMRQLVEGEMDRLGLGKDAEGEGMERWKADTRQAAVARALEELVNEAAVYPADEAAFAHLQDVLDLVLTMWECGHVDETLPLNLLTSLMELRPIAACDPLFGYIESRVERLTKGMEYQRGRGPILLRLLNDLLRRLPRSQSAPVILSGRILLLLSSVYPLGEKSGVNLRGNFNTGKGGVVLEEEAKREMESAEEDAKKEEEEQAEAEKKGEEVKDEQMEVEEGEEGEEKEPEEKKNGAGGAGGKDGKDDDPDANPAATNPSQFYTTFWSLQCFFNNPHLLFSSGPKGAAAPEDPFATLHHGLLKTLAAFRAATKRERELAGAAKDEKTKGEGKADVPKEVEVEMKALDDPDATDASLEQYFFPKFLTSRNLLDLELADPSFRRQLLLQTLILLQYLLSLTPSARARAASLPVTNQSAFPSFVLGEENEKWVREVRERVLNELDAMGSVGGEGRLFRKAVQVVLQREQNWTDWKLRSCASFTRSPSVTPSAQSDSARSKMRVLTARPKAFPFKMGNPQLSKAWEKNTVRLGDMEEEGGLEDAAEDLDRLFRDHRLERNRLKQVEQQLKAAAPGSAKRFELEGAVETRRTRLQALQWRAIRLASSSHLSFFSQIGAGDLDKLQQLIDEERRAREEEAEEAAAEAAPAGGGEEEGGEGKEVKTEEEKEMEMEEGKEGYDSDESVLGFGREKREREQKEKEERERREREEKERVKKEKAAAEAKAAKAAKEKEEEEERERERVKKEQEQDEAGTPPPQPPVAAAGDGDATMGDAADDDGGETPPRPSAAADTPPPPPAAAAAPAADEPATPPPKDAETKLPPSPGTPGTPGTPKRPRADEGEDTEMKPEEGRAKRSRRR